jgi:hypothetical protein
MILFVIEEFFAISPLCVFVATMMLFHFLITCLCLLLSEDTMFFLVASFDLEFEYIFCLQHIHMLIL